MDIQKFIDSINEAGKIERSRYHLTLGKLISKLREANSNDHGHYEVKTEYNNQSVSVDGAESYRGYYSDLALRPCMRKTLTVKEVLTILQNILNKNLTGYKGGEFLMDQETPLWISIYGQADSLAIVNTKLNHEYKEFELQLKYIE